MSLEEADDSLADAVNRRSEALIIEAGEFVELCLTNVEGSTAQNAYQTWGIKKIAELQLIVERQSSLIKELARRAGLQ